MKQWVAIGFFLGFSMFVSAEVYRWVDSAGKTHYGDRTPENLNDKANKLNIKNTQVVPDPEAEAARQKLRALDEGRQREQAYAAQKSAELQQNREQGVKRCKALANDIRDEQRVAVMFSYDNAGNRVVWTSEQRVAYKEKLQNLKQRYCSDTAE
jgi:predicted transcriptional regulator